MELLQVESPQNLFPILNGDFSKFWHVEMFKQISGRVDAATFELDAATSSSRVADAAASKMVMHVKFL